MKIGQDWRIFRNSERKIIQQENSSNNFNNICYLFSYILSFFIHHLPEEGEVKELSEILQ